MLIKVDGTFSQVLANIIRLSNSVSKSFMHYLDHISQEKDVLSLYTEATEFVDTNNIPLLSKVSHFVESWLTHESSDKRNSITKFNLDAEVRFLLSSIFTAWFSCISDLKYL